MASRPIQNAEPSSHSLHVSCNPVKKRAEWAHSHPQPRLTPISTSGSCLIFSPAAVKLLSIGETSIVRPTVPVPQTTAATCLMPGSCRAGAASRLTSMHQYLIIS